MAMTLYDLLRKLTTGTRMWENEQADALALIDRMEALNAFGSTAIFEGEHECESDNNPTYSAVESPNWRGQKYFGGPKVCHCKHCGKEMPG